MDYRRYQDRIVLRLDAGDEVCDCLKTVAKKECIITGSISGIGGADKLTVGIFNTEKKEYTRYEYSGTHEITSITGNITNLNDEPYIHVHITAAGENAKIVAGHLLSACISLTAEIFIDIINGKTGRTRNETLGINEISF